MSSRPRPLQWRYLRDPGGMKRKHALGFEPEVKFEDGKRLVLEYRTGRRPIWIQKEMLNPYYSDEEFDDDNDRPRLNTLRKFIAEEEIRFKVGELYRREEAYFQEIGWIKNAVRNDCRLVKICTEQLERAYNNVYNDRAWYIGLGKSQSGSIVNYKRGIQRLWLAKEGLLWANRLTLGRYDPWSVVWKNDRVKGDWELEYDKYMLCRRQRAIYPLYMRTLN